MINLSLFHSLLTFALILHFVRLRVPSCLTLIPYIVSNQQRALLGGEKRKHKLDR